MAGEGSLDNAIDTNEANLDSLGAAGQAKGVGVNAVTRRYRDRYGVHIGTRRYPIAQMIDHYGFRFQKAPQIGLRAEVVRQCLQMICQIVFLPGTLHFPAINIAALGTGPLVQAQCIGCGFRNMNPIAELVTGALSHKNLSSSGSVADAYSYLCLQIPDCSICQAVVVNC